MSAAAPIHVKRLIMHRRRHSEHRLASIWSDRSPRTQAKCRAIAPNRPEPKRDAETPGVTFKEADIFSPAIHRQTARTPYGPGKTAPAAREEPRQTPLCQPSAAGFSTWTALNARPGRGQSDPGLFQRKATQCAVGGVLARRKPLLLLFRLSLLLRLADRRFLGLLFQDPPRRRAVQAS